MRVEIPVAFKVESEECDLDERAAKDAAEQAAFHFLAFCEISGYSSDTDTVEVDVDGFGRCKVTLVKE